MKPSGNVSNNALANGNKKQRRESAGGSNQNREENKNTLDQKNWGHLDLEVVEKLSWHPQKYSCLDPLFHSHICIANLLS